MPLADLFNLQWYGPESAAAVDQIVVAAESQAGVNTYVNAFNLTLPTTPVVHAAVGKYGAGEDIATPTAPRTEPGVISRMNALGKVTELSQEELAGSLANLPVEGNLKLVEAVRLLLAVAAGNATDLDANPAFKSVDGSKTRVAGVRSGGTRTIITRDGT